MTTIVPFVKYYKLFELETKKNNAYTGGFFIIQCNTETINGNSCFSH